MGAVFRTHGLPGASLAVPSLSLEQALENKLSPNYEPEPCIVTVAKMEMLAVIVQDTKSEQYDARHRSHEKVC